MKIRTTRADNRKKQLEIVTYSGRVLTMPYAMCEPPPTPQDRIKRVWVDAELGKEGVSYCLASGAEGALHVDHFLCQNLDPEYMRAKRLYLASMAAKKAMATSPLSQREVARRLKTSVPQLRRLLDPTNKTKSLDGTLALLDVLGHRIALTIESAA